jgi:hypothetical protein
MTPLNASVGSLETLCVEIGQDRPFFIVRVPAEAGAFRDPSGLECSNRLVGEFPASFRPGGVDIAELLVALPGQADFVVRVPGGEFRVQP